MKIQSPAELKLPTINPQAEWRLSFSVPHRIFRYSPVKISSRQDSPVVWHTTQASDSPTVVPRLLVYSIQKILALPNSSQGFIFPGSSQDSFVSSPPGFIYPQQDSSSAYMRIHHIHIINIDVTYIASRIMTLHTTNSLPFQERSVNRRRSPSSGILSRNSSDVAQTWRHSDTYSRTTQK